LRRFAATGPDVRGPTERPGEEPAISFDPKPAVLEGRRLPIDHTALDWQQSSTHLHVL
jgi:hypothetical protein